ncbi:hypothetical protein ACOTCS_24595 [Achromobacter xylosoxidans]
MQKSQSPPPRSDTQDAVQQLNALRQSEVRARFRTLLPLIDELVRQGVPYVAIAAALESAGIPMKVASIRQARCRWRRQQSKVTARISPGASREASAMTAMASTPQPPSPAPNMRRPGTVTTKGDLVQLRKSADTIDLNQLAELGRQK